MSRHTEDTPVLLDRLEPLEAFARWIVALDDPDGPGAEARKSMTVEQIISKAREVLPGTTPPSLPHTSEEGDTPGQVAPSVVQPRRLKVTRLSVTVLTNPTDTQKRIDRGERSNAQDTRGRQTRISVARFRPTSTGYRLLSTAPHSFPEAG
ncbi:hypothetical protein [Nonomuraea sp. NPDC001831]|uniref:hypothetical protein n=1 Tax=Nonomuraea sp. NPDC001831 TaxID=3364340 RepID=UPI0036A2B8B0